ncbi:MAG: hypothetical protein RLZZ520_293, partial [Bacteroidota bacterium]
MKKQFFVLFFLPVLAFSQQSEVYKVRDFRVKNESVLLNHFKEFLQIPNIASDLPNILKNAAWISNLMQSKGIANVQLLSPITPDKPPAVYGEVITPGATETVVFYAHYDGQPVDSTKWTNGLHPFKPQLTSNSLIKDGKIIPW